MHLPPSINLKAVGLKATFFTLLLSNLVTSDNAAAQNLAESKLAAVPQASEVFVMVQAAKIRQSPKPWATGLAAVKFGDKLVQLASQDSWLRVRNSQDLEGFLHSTAVTGKKIVLSASKEDLLNSRVDEPDVYLAGKGFNNEVLQELSSKEPTLNFAAVDTMQKQAIIEESTLFAFIKSGRLNEGQK